MAWVKVRRLSNGAAIEIPVNTDNVCYARPQDQSMGDGPGKATLILVTGGELVLDISPDEWYNTAVDSERESQ